MRRTLAFALALSATQAVAHDYTLGDLKVMHPMAFETSAMAQAGGGYLEVMNTGDAADTLIAVEADFPRVEIHTTVMDGDVAKMQKVEGVDVPAGETVALKPGGFHVMFMGLGNDPFEVGDEIPAVLVFENAGRIEVVFNVEERPSDLTSGHDHSDHDHSSHDH